MDTPQRGFPCLCWSAILEFNQPTTACICVMGCDPRVHRPHSPRDEPVGAGISIVKLCKIVESIELCKFPAPDQSRAFLSGCDRRG